MSKATRRKSRQGPFLKSEVKQALTSWHTYLSAKDEQDLASKALNWRGEILGFPYWGHYMQLASGWYLAPEDVCEYCLYHGVLNHGSRAERLRWRQANQAAYEAEGVTDGIDPVAYPMPVSNREMAEYRADERRRRKQWRKPYRARRTLAADFL